VLQTSPSLLQSLSLEHEGNRAQRLAGLIGPLQIADTYGVEGQSVALRQADVDAGVPDVDVAALPSGAGVDVAVLPSGAGVG
jgi:hypothetical protein